MHHRRLLHQTSVADTIYRPVFTNQHLQIVQGEMNDLEALFMAMSKASLVLSLLGPSITNKSIKPDLFATQYLSSVFPAMRKCGVRRIIAMGTISISRPDDRWTMFHKMVSIFMKLFAAAIYQNMQNIAKAFEEDAKDLDWTIFRIARIPGEADEENWRNDRGGEIYAGPVGGKGWTTSIQRASLTKWIVDNMQSKAWFSKMPALSERAK